MRGQIRVVFVQIRIVEVTFHDALAQAVWYRHVGHAAVIGEHASVTGEPVATLHAVRYANQLREEPTEIADLDLDP
jgi:hypothetical protein